MTVRNYKDLEIWQDGIRFVLAIYKVTATFPREEQFGLTSQLRRAAVSIPSNIAEGHIQVSDAVFARHLQIALGSAAETDTQLLITQQLGYLSLEQMTDLRAQVKSLIRRMRSFHTRLTL
jgi:four helix bundle protein